MVGLLRSASPGWRGRLGWATLVRGVLRRNILEVRERERWLSPGVIDRHSHFLPSQSGRQVFCDAEESRPVVPEGRPLNDDSAGNVDLTPFELAWVQENVKNVLRSLFFWKAEELLHDVLHCRRTDKGRHLGQGSLDFFRENFLGSQICTSPPTEAHTMYPTEAQTVALARSSSGGSGSEVATSPRVTDAGFSKYRVVRRNPSGTGIPLAVSSSTLARRVAVARRSESGDSSISLSICVNSGCDATSASLALSSLICSGVGDSCVAC